MGAGPVSRNFGGRGENRSLRHLIRIGIVTGLAAEVNCLKRSSAATPTKTLDPPLIYCAGANTARARDCARRLVAEGAQALLSFGVAGGCDPAYDPGDLIVAESVLSTDATPVRCDEAWRERFTRCIAGQISASVAPIFGSRKAITTPREKRALFENHGVATVDMESAGVAAFAASAGVPFLAIRAVADPADGNIPQAALASISPDGHTRALPVLRSLLRTPQHGFSLLKLASDSGRALRCLRRVATIGVPTFGFA